MRTVKSPTCNRIMIEKVTPQIDGGVFPIKRVVTDQVVVRACVFADGHDEVCATLLYRRQDAPEWHEVKMKFLGNDQWIGAFFIEEEKNYLYSVRGYVHEFLSWRHDLEKRIAAKQDVFVALQIGARLIKEAAARAKGTEGTKLKAWGKQLESADAGSLQAALTVVMSQELLDLMEANFNKKKSVTFERELLVAVEPKLAQFSSWYELFPRSWSVVPGKHGTFKECVRLLPEIARMGFDVIYLPPIHPIGSAHRKGKNNSTRCEPNDPGSPWAIGSSEGGHKAVHPQLGMLDDFRNFLNKAKEHNLAIALDIAFQCSPDHPYVKDHPSWFKWRPDGTIQYAENPPKKYEDVLPLNFETEDTEDLWEELKSIFLFWAQQGVRFFRVDNPHTKPFCFWDWLIKEVKAEYPDAVFLSEAFTRPNIMYRLAKGGFTQSYTYFTWRSTKKDFTEYLTELSQSEVAEYFRPNFWPNTPDILPEHLQTGGRPAFMMRAILAATLSSNFGIYGPAYELCVSEAVAPGKEEYLNSEKYEIKKWDWNQEGNLKELFVKLNKIRKENPCLQVTRNIRFCAIDNDELLAFYKATGDYSNILLVVVNLDPRRVQSGWVKVPLEKFGLKEDQSYVVQDLLSGHKYTWQGEKNYVELDPEILPAHIFRIKRVLPCEKNFDYFM
ncbi:MAG: alpha-1,4-glucan--maltose-1-phosphate maltosyltransferase [Candidatus Omnitrophica bacterium]|nr:alpha-1,4-glucan--maltose-1-phosphate maltosyltransferase [Candidatus Omnitrophota bacterium]